MRLATVCSGIGVAELAAMEVWGDAYELVFACEIDQFARQTFEANHEIKPGQFHISVDDNPLNLYKDSFPYTTKFYRTADGRRIKIDKYTKNRLKLIAKKRPKFKEFSNILTDEFLERYKGLIDILVGGTPCQNFSLAGLREGLEGKTGILIWQYFRIVKAIMPPVFIWENVKGFISDKKGKTLKDFLEVFRSIGYNCHYGVIDTQDYGVPQHRERIYIVGFLDVDAYYRFSFAPKVPLTKRLKDVLETDVDEKYYLSSSMVNFLKQHTVKHKAKGNGFEFSPKGEDDVGNCLRAQSALAVTDNVIKQLNPNYVSQCNTIHDTQGVSPTLCAGTHGYAHGYIECNVGDSINIKFPNSTTRRGRVGKGIANALETSMQQVVVTSIKQEGIVGMLDIKGNDQIRRVYGVDGVAPTLNTMQGGNREPKILQKSQSGVRYRNECGTLSATGNRSDMTVVESIAFDDYNGNVNHDGIAYTLTCKCGSASNNNGQKILEPKIVAMRGRNPDNPTSRKSGLPTVQGLEENVQGISNTIYTVQKDNLVQEQEFLLRKLTPRECLRLQDVPDSFKQVVSDSQLYKQAGNAKSRNVVIMLFRQIDHALKGTTFNLFTAYRSA